MGRRMVGSITSVWNEPEVAALSALAHASAHTRAHVRGQRGHPIQRNCSTYLCILRHSQIDALFLALSSKYSIHTGVNVS